MAGEGSGADTRGGKKSDRRIAGEGTALKVDDGVTGVCDGMMCV